jgi:hypothetical protein
MRTARLGPDAPRLRIFREGAANERLAVGLQLHAPSAPSLVPERESAHFADKYAPSPCTGRGSAADRNALAALLVEDTR